MVGQNSSYNTSWLEAIVRFVETSCHQNSLFNDFLSRGREFRSELSRCGLPGVEDAEYQPVWGAIRNSAQNFIASSSDKQEAAGALLWRLLKSPYMGQRMNAIQYFRNEKCYQRNIVHLVNIINLPLSAKDKINALTCLNYKYTTEDYQTLYRTLGDFDIGKNPNTLEYEKEQTVRLFYDLLDSSKKSTWKNKVSSAAVLLETIARNAPHLKGVSYEGKTIDAEARAKMLAIMKKSRLTFSEQCMSYFSSADDLVETNVKIADYWERTNAETYIGVVLNKFRTIQRGDQRRFLFDETFPKIHSLIDKRVSISDKLIDNYSAYLSLYAAEFRGRDVSVDVLEQLLLRNAEQKNERRKQESLFPELLYDEELTRYDKNNVLKVAENYGASLERGHFFNVSFNEDMISLLQRIVSSNLYKKEEVQAVCDALRGSDDRESCGAQTAREIMLQYTSSCFVDRWRAGYGSSGYH